MRSLNLELAETTTALFTQYFRLKYGYDPSQSQLENCARQIFESALESEMVSEFENISQAQSLAAVAKYCEARY